MTAVADPIAALIKFLQSDADVDAACADRVYGAELPQSSVRFMPRTSVVLQPAGGSDGQGSYLQVGEMRIDIWCYGTTPLTAFDLYRAVHGALKQMRRNLQGQTVLHWAKVGASSRSVRDPETEWPATWSSWVVMWSEQEANA